MWVYRVGYIQLMLLGRKACLEEEGLCFNFQLGFFLLHSCPFFYQWEAVCVKRGFGKPVEKTRILVLFNNLLVCKQRNKLRGHSLQEFKKIKNKSSHFPPIEVLQIVLIVKFFFLFE